MSTNAPSRRALLVLLLSAIAAADLTAQGPGRSVTVGPNGLFADIQPAIDWIQTQPNPVDWVVRVQWGLAYSPFVIDGTFRPANISVVSDQPGRRYTISAAHAHVIIFNVGAGQVENSSSDMLWDVRDGR